MRIGMLTSSASRNGGGVFPAACGLAAALEEIGPISVKLFGVEDEYSADDQALWRNLEIRAERPAGPRSFGFAPHLSGSLQSAGLDLIHVHGIWMYPSIASHHWARRQRRPYVVSPHGMLDSWAVANSRWKKRIAGALYEHRHLRGAACLHALTAAEAKAIRAYGLRNPVCVIPNGVQIPEHSLQRAEREIQTLLYLGRLHPKKGIAALLRAWASARSVPGADNWRLVIAGWDDGGYLGELQRLAHELSIDDNVAFAGPQFGAEKAVAYARASAFVLPSLSEGLPIAVLEAWASGMPVLMTPECNLPEGFEAGAAIPIAASHADQICAALNTLFSASPAQLCAMGACGRRLVEQRFSWNRVASEMKQVYGWVLGLGPMPSSVTIQ
jgi:glycosyltransferase involved in cell wall biosynthesis